MWAKSCSAGKAAEQGNVLFYFNHMDIRQFITGLAEDNIGNQRGVLRLKTVFRGSHRNRNPIVAHVRYAIGIALGNHQTFNLGFLQGYVYNIL